MQRRRRRLRKYFQLRQSLRPDIHEERTYWRNHLRMDRCKNRSRIDTSHISIHHWPCDPSFCNAFRWCIGLRIRCELCRRRLYMQKRIFFKIKRLAFTQSAQLQLDAENKSHSHVLSKTRTDFCLIKKWSTPDKKTKKFAFFKQLTSLGMTRKYI